MWSIDDGIRRVFGGRENGFSVAVSNPSSDCDSGSSGGILSLSAGLTMDRGSASISAWTSLVIVPRTAVVAAAATLDYTFFSLERLPIFNSFRFD